MAWSNDNRDTIEWTGSPGRIKTDKFIGDGSLLTNVSASSFSGVLPVVNGGTGNTDRTLDDVSLTTSLNWSSRILYEGLGVTEALNWSARRLTYSDGSTASVLWNDGILNDSANSYSVDWNNRVLKDASAIDAIDYGNRVLYDEELNAVIEFASGLVLNNPLSIANGGTNTSSFTTASGMIYYDGTKLTNSANCLFDGTYLYVAGNSATSTLRVGTLEFQNYTTNNCWFGDNVYYNGSFQRRVTGAAGLFYFQGTEGQFRFYSSGTGSLGSGVGNTVQLKISNYNGGTTAFGGSGSNATNVFTGFSMYADSNGLTLADGKNLIVNTSTGTKLATSTGQKLGFWNKTPIVQPSTSTAVSAAFVANTSGIADDSATYDGYRISQIVGALRSMGLLA